MKPFSLSNDALENYVTQTFQPEDLLLEDVRSRSEKAGLPSIQVGKMDGLHLEILARSANAKKIVEIGTLGGYSGLCLARGMSDDGHLYTFEFEPRHAAVAKETFEKAHLSEKVTILVGPALENLKKIEDKGPFDLVFIDADKPSYPAYLEWAIAYLRRGGLILADNTLSGGDITKSSESELSASPRLRALRAYNETVSHHPKLRSTILPTGDGLTVSVKI